MEVLLDWKNKIDAYLQAAADQQSQLSKLNQGSVAIQLETYQLLVKNGGRCTGSTKLSSKDREDDTSRTRDPSSNNERRRQRVAATWQKRKLQMNIEQQASGQSATVQGEQSGWQGQAEGQAQADGRTSRQEATNATTTAIRVNSSRVASTSGQANTCRTRPAVPGSSEDGTEPWTEWRGAYGNLAGIRCILCITASIVLSPYLRKALCVSFVFHDSVPLIALLPCSCCSSDKQLLTCQHHQQTMDCCRACTLSTMRTVSHCSNKHMQVCATRVRSYSVPKLGRGVC